MSTEKRILIRAPNWVGDAVLALSAIRDIRAGFPQAEITVMARPSVSGVFSSVPYINDVWIEPRPSSIRDWLRVIRAIRERRFDMVVLLPNSFESAVLAFLSRIPKRVGYST